MRSSKSTLFTAALIAMAGVSHTQAHAVTIGFASFDVVTAGNTFQFTNTGSTSNFGLTSSPINVAFRYKTANGYAAPNTAIAATLTLTSSVDGTAYTSGPPNLVRYDQLMKNIQMVFTANTAVNGKTNLLTVTGTGDLSGNKNGSTADFKGDTGLNDTVNFASDFLNFSGVFIAKNFALSFSAVNPTLSLDGDGYLSAFNAQGNGQFASDPVPPSNVPEPGTIALFCGMGVTGSVFLRRRMAGKRA